MLQNGKHSKKGQGSAPCADTGEEIKSRTAGFLRGVLSSQGCTGASERKMGKFR